jgi:hypothetical protein
METVKLGNIEIEFDAENNREFYAGKNGFVCTCPDCINYVDKLPTVKKLIGGLDDKLGFDLSKDVGQGMDELMPHDNDDHCLYVIPYYINGKCKINGIELVKVQNGPIWPNTAQAKYKINEDLSVTIVNTTDAIKFKNSKAVLTIWLEFKTPLLEKD